MMDLVHLAHLIIVLVQLIQQVFKQIYLPVSEKRKKSFNRNVYIYLHRSYEKYAFNVNIWWWSASLVFTNITVKVCFVSREMHQKGDDLLDK
jgi:hypothetical protein